MRACLLPFRRQRTWVPHDVLKNRAISLLQVLAWVPYYQLAKLVLLLWLQSPAYGAPQGRAGSMGLRRHQSGLSIASRLGAFSSRLTPAIPSRHFHRGRAAPLH